MANQLKITLIKSINGQKPKIRGSVRALGLKRIRHTVVKNDDAVTRGMIKSAAHMVEVEEV